MTSHTHTRALDTEVFKTHLSSFLMGIGRDKERLTDRKVNHCDHFSGKKKEKKRRNNNQAMMAIMIMTFLCVSLDFPLLCFY